MTRDREGGDNDANANDAVGALVAGSQGHVGGEWGSSGGNI